jgi:ketosteroid isomerase-like protein
MSDASNEVRNLYAAFARGDVPVVLGALAPDVHWTEAEGFPHGGCYVGPDAVLQNVFVNLGAEWDRFVATPETFVTSADTVIVLGEYSGTSKATGQSFTAPFVHVWQVRNGKIAKFQQHTDTAVVQRALQPRGSRDA